jgi:hypothetical protein
VYRRAAGLPFRGAQQTRRFQGTYEHPGFKPTKTVGHAKSLLVVKETKIRGEVSCYRRHFHGRVMNSAENYQKVISIMDQVGLE